MDKTVPFDLQAFCEDCGVPDVPAFIGKCEKLYELLLETNSKTNLTRISSPDEYWNKHVADSLSSAKYFPQLRDSELKIADIGCGAGFPSLILAAAFPQLDITAIDSIGKKTAFVQSAGKALKLDGLSVLTARARELNRKDEWIRHFDIITARAVAEARILFRETRNMLKEDGMFIFYKTPEQAKDDFEKVSKDSAKYSFEWTLGEIFALPAGDGERQFLHTTSRQVAKPPRT